MLTDSREQAGRAVEDHEVVVVGEAGEHPAEPVLAALARGEVKITLQAYDVFRRQQVEPVVRRTADRAGRLALALQEPPAAACTFALPRRMKVAAACGSRSHNKVR